MKNVIKMSSIIRRDKRDPYLKSAPRRVFDKKAMKQTVFVGGKVRIYLPFAAIRVYDEKKVSIHDNDHEMIRIYSKNHELIFIEISGKKFQKILTKAYYHNYKKGEKKWIKRIMGLVDVASEIEFIGDEGADFPLIIYRDIPSPIPYKPKYFTKIRKILG